MMIAPYSGFTKEFSDQAAYPRLRPTEENVFVESIDKRGRMPIYEISG
jgi:hypothetical protein